MLTGSFTLCTTDDAIACRYIVLTHIASIHRQSAELLCLRSCVLTKRQQDALRSVLTYVHKRR
jgi:hypothetical protein